MSLSRCPDAGTTPRLGGIRCPAPGFIRPITRLSDLPMPPARVTYSPFSVIGRIRWEDESICSPQKSQLTNHPITRWSGRSIARFHPRPKHFSISDIGRDGSEDEGEKAGEAAGRSLLPRAGAHSPDHPIIRSPDGRRHSGWLSSTAWGRRILGGSTGETWRRGAAGSEEGAADGRARRRQFVEACAPDPLT
jgi:hypothetical protein